MTCYVNNKTCPSPPLCFPPLSLSGSLCIYPQLFTALCFLWHLLTDREEPPCKLPQNPSQVLILRIAHGVPRNKYTNEACSHSGLAQVRIVASG